MTEPRVTHEVLNQVRPLAGHDVAQDPALLEALDREGPAPCSANCTSSARWPAPSRPKSRPGSPTSTYPGSGRTTGTATGSTRSTTTRPGTPSCRWRSRTACTPLPVRHPARTWPARPFYVSRPRPGTAAPVSMTYAAVPALRHAPGAGPAVRAAARLPCLRPRPAPAADVKAEVRWADRLLLPRWTTIGVQHQPQRPRPWSAAARGGHRAILDLDDYTRPGRLDSVRRGAGPRCLRLALAVANPRRLPRCDPVAGAAQRATGGDTAAAATRCRCAPCPRKYCGSASAL